MVLALFMIIITGVEFVIFMHGCMVSRTSLAAECRQLGPQQQHCTKRDARQQQQRANHGDNHLRGTLCS